MKELEVKDKDLDRIIRNVVAHARRRVLDDGANARGAPKNAKDEVESLLKRLRK